MGMGMDFRLLAKIIIGGGALVVAASVLWWMQFYGWVTAPGPNHYPIAEVTHCLFITSADCYAASVIGNLAGQMPYPSWLIWVGIVLIISGAVLVAVTKPTASPS